jgi:hypothetical protein
VILDDQHFDIRRIRTARLSVIVHEESEDKMLKTALYTLLFALLLVTTGWFVVFEFGSVVSRRGVSDLHITTNSSRHPAIVSVDGGLISSSNAVGSVKQRRKGRCIVVLVREVLVRDGRRSATFHLDVVITDDVDEIGFGDSHDIIWHR